jgi:hypothetical protein
MFYMHASPENGQFGEDAYVVCIVGDRSCRSYHEEQTILSKE